MVSTWIIFNFAFFKDAECEAYQKHVKAITYSS